jgi:hypothetical protein
MIPYSLINQFNSSTRFIESIILTRNEGISLTQLLNYPSEVKLIYTSRDVGFFEKVDGILNTVIVSKTELNSVFGGFQSEPWTQSSDHYSIELKSSDENSFMFSLRKYGNPNLHRFNNSKFGFTFLIEISYYFWENIAIEKSEYIYSLTGSSRGNQNEVYEVYEVISFEAYSVTPLHHGCLFFISLLNFIFILIFL